MGAIAAPAADLVVALDDRVGMAFRRIPAGCSVMGARGVDPDEEPSHRVRITQAFYLGMYPVTQAEFAVWTREATAKHRNHFEGNPSHPAESLDWFQAMAFCRWLSETCASQLPQGHLGSLPTEAEWEHACRAGTATEYYTGDGEAALQDAAWFGEEFEGGSTHPVGLKAANDFGLFDMHGNVWEWCWDAWDADAYRKRVDGVADPGAAERWAALHSEAVVESREGDPDRVLRGGSWAAAPGGAAPRVATGGGPATATTAGASGSVWFPVRCRDRTEQRLETEPGGTPWRSRKARARRVKGWVFAT